MKRAALWTGLIIMAILGAAGVEAAPPELDFWLLNVSGLTGYNGLPADIQRIRYSTDNAYVNASGIPYYTIGPWPGNPNTVTNQDKLFRFPRNPVVNAGTKTATSLGAIGVWVNGVAIYNALDAHSYNNLNIWHQNAVIVEAGGFDACLGHPPPSGQYHHHQRPRCLDATDSDVHSRILGFAFDGFPVYGPHGYANSDGSGGVARIRSSYRLRSITTRTTLPDGTVLMPAQYGPSVSATFPLGYYVEDFEYVSGLGDLDAYNGRIAVTPEYPAGTYAYYTTLDAGGATAYPYVIGPRYYGVVANDNVTSMGHVTIAEPVADYTPTSVGAGGAGTTTSVRLGQNTPNPAVERATIAFSVPVAGRVSLRLFDLAGRIVQTLVDREMPAGSHSVPVDVSRLRAGAYFYQLRARGGMAGRKLLIVR